MPHDHGTENHANEDHGADVLGAELHTALILELLGRCEFGVARPVECAVSGGPDSMALLVLACAAGLEVTAVHVDHGLRAGSAQEANIVQRAADRFGAGFESRKVDLTDGPNLEARARAARYAVLSDEALTGHTLDDQAETLLMFLMRGTGPSGMAGMDGGRRPLLGLRRAETVALCESLGIEVVTDPSNVDPRFTRNRVRSELVPLMNGISGRDVSPLLARFAELQGELIDGLNQAADELDPTDAHAIASAPRALAAAALRMWWRHETGLGYTPDAAGLGRMIDVANGNAVAADIVDGWRIARTAQVLRLLNSTEDERRSREPS